MANRSLFPFSYSAIAQRRHGPLGYTNYESYRPWLRDEFTFRCVYCLLREQWGRSTGAFDIDHFVPQACDRSKLSEYDNLVYCCRACNVRKGILLVPDPTKHLTAETARVRLDGHVEGLTDDAARLIDILTLNSPAWVRWRLAWIRIIELAAETDLELLRYLLGFPDDLPIIIWQGSARERTRVHPASTPVTSRNASADNCRSSTSRSQGASR